MFRSITLLTIFTCLLQGCVHQQAIVASADDRATQAGIRILKQGGSAIDAAIAVQSVLSLVEPQSSGLGGGAFMLYYDAKHKKLHAFDGREAAPAAINPKDFIKPNGQAKGYFDTAFGGQSVGVPGVMALLGKTHAQYGNHQWSTLFEDAKDLATHGFAVSPRLSQWLSRFPHNKAHPTMLEYFYDANGKARPAGYTLRNPAYANTLSITAQEGSDTFYTGRIARQIVKAVNTSPITPSAMSLEDLANYLAIERQPLCAQYHDYTVCSVGPPTSGGVFLLQTLGVLSHFTLAQFKPYSTQSLHLIIEASRLSYADRQQYIADPEFVQIPLSGLLNQTYLSERASLINPHYAAINYSAGNPERYDLSLQKPIKQAPHVGKEYPSTSHFSIRDQAGNVVSMTTTVQGPFGSFLPAGGLLLNNQLTDFYYLSEQNGKPIANAIKPGKRPRSSMTPTIVFDAAGNVKLVIGSPGGGRIFSYVLKTLIGVLDWQLPLQAAIDAPNVSLPDGHVELEAGRFEQSIIEQLKLLGHPLKLTKQTSGLNGFAINQSGYDAGVDKRREGTFMISD